MTADPSFLGGWDRALSGAVGVLLGFGLSQAKDWWTRRRKHAAYWRAIDAEVQFARGRAESVLNDRVGAPLYRLPRTAFNSCYPELLADGAISAAQGTALMAFFNEVDSLNRGLDLAAQASDATRLQEEYGRNRLKAERLIAGGPLYEAAAAAIRSHVA